MTVPEAAEFLGVKESTVYELVALRKLAHYRVGARGRGKIVLERADVEAFKASCRVEPEGPRSTRVPPKPRPKGLGLSMAEFPIGRKVLEANDKGASKKPG